MLAAGDDRGRRQGGVAPSPLARFRAPNRLEVRGAPAAAMPRASGHFVFTGEATVHLQGPDATLLRRAAEALQPLDGSATGDLPRPPDEIVAELRARCSP
jgi:hypothetical protein